MATGGGQQIIKGNDLMLFYAGTSLAYATSHTLSMTGETTDITTKDHAGWDGVMIDKISWEITSENLYTANDFDTLFAAMLAKNAVDVVFGLCGGTATGAHTSGNSTDGQPLIYDHKADKATSKYSGKAVITSLSVNASAGENATYSVTLTGSGALSKVAS